ncbi:hypothetical protein PNEG_04335 [Pneumocystis murina B123]|uniref:Uncharacterized protein n=1 Tax=Pneumocystis murina (strain B123) TaxID=1069680 RepID=A0A0W4ZWX2_PNEMU|nr:hypothetical protein PNEG_04335 [Pneumocystis murina B123]KTW32859.1 hypothetical protein PNEG_04335 [Pneumocystis murina B123]
MIKKITLFLKSSVHNVKRNISVEDNISIKFLFDHGIIYSLFLCLEMKVNGEYFISSILGFFFKLSTILIIKFSVFYKSIEIIFSISNSDK